jgi:hypothetical protein
MKRSLYVFLACLLLLSGCQKINKIEKPENLLSKSEMKGLIYDMILLDATYGINKKKFEEINTDMLEFLTKKYQIDSTQIKLNIQYYNINFNDNLEIYEAVKDSIQRLDSIYIHRAQEIDSLKILELNKQDSIVKLDSLSLRKIIKRE